MNTLNNADESIRDEFDSYAEVISRTCSMCDVTKDYPMCPHCGCCHQHCECGITQRQQTLKLSPAQLKMLRKLNYEGDLSIYKIGRYQQPTLMALYRRGYAGMGIFDSGQYVWRITSAGQQALSKQELTNIILSNSTLTALFTKGR